jgi:hypothetical protein
MQEPEGRARQVRVIEYTSSRGRILERNPDKSQRVFRLAIQSHVYIFALKIIFLQTHATSYGFYSVLLYTVKKKGGTPAW